nr:MAG: antirepressor protein KilAC domain protein [Bacteriophage sp.]UVN09271.1 MAG: antirepressor protein KilAC domain protein [Bacteriophage sp.]
MNTEIQTFNFDSASLRTLTDENGEPWFVGKDVATILGYTNPRKALIDHVDDEDKTDGVTIRDSIGREQNPIVINESGLYSLILGSKLPTAKRFKRWVTHEVLPTIRKTGGYIPTTNTDDDMTILAKAVLVAQKTIDLKNQQLQAKDAQIKELEPKAKALDAFTNVEDRLLVRDAAKVLSNAGTPITEKQLREWMADNGWIYKANCSWHATARHCTAGHLVMVMSQDHVTKADGTKFAYPPTVRITRKGLALLHRRIGETRLANALEGTTTD